VQNELDFHICLFPGGILQILQEVLVSGRNYLILLRDLVFLGVPGFVLSWPFFPPLKQQILELIDKATNTNTLLKKTFRCLLLLFIN